MKTALIVGGARIGREVALALIDNGWRVILGYKTSRGSAREVQHQVMNSGFIDIQHVDATSKSSVHSLENKIRKKHKNIDALIHMASLYEKSDWTEFDSKKNRSIWTSHIDTSLRMSRLAYHLFPQKRGKIILFSDWVSASGRPRYKNFVDYYVAKTALIGLTEALALELSPKSTVNCVAPGPILPPKFMKNEETRKIAHVTPMGKWGGASEISRVVLYLLGADFTTGECIRVDGGRHLL